MKDAQSCRDINCGEGIDAFDRGHFILPVRPVSMKWELVVFSHISFDS
jgi:hypothetical protein